MAADGNGDGVDIQSIQLLDHPVHRRTLDPIFFLHCLDGLIHRFLTTAKPDQLLGTLPHLLAPELLYALCCLVVGEMTALVEQQLFQELTHQLLRLCAPVLQIVPVCFVCAKFFFDRLPLQAYLHSQCPMIRKSVDSLGHEQLGRLVVPCRSC